MIRLFVYLFCVPKTVACSWKMPILGGGVNPFTEGVTFEASNGHIHYIAVVINTKTEFPSFIQIFVKILSFGSKVSFITKFRETKMRF